MPGSSYLDTTLMSGLGRKRRTHRKRGTGILSDIIGSIGLGRRVHRKKRGGAKVVRSTAVSGLGRRRKRGRGFFDKIKSGLSSALKFAAPLIAGPILGKAGAAIGSKVFGGRKRRRVHTKKVSLASLIQKLKGGRRRVHRRKH